MTFLIFLFISLSSVFAEWEADMRLTNDAGGVSETSMGRGKCIAAEGNYVHISWMDSRDGNYEIYYKRSSDNGLSWGNDFRLSNAPDSSRNPSIAVSGTNIYIFWTDKRDGNFEVYYRISSDKGNSWGDEIRLTSTPGPSGVPTIAVEGSEIHLVWREEKAGNNETFYAKSNDYGVSWSKEINLSNDSPSSFNQCIAKSGVTIFAIWENQGAPTKHLISISKDNGESWSNNVGLNFQSSRNLPQLIANQGRLYYVWNDSKDGYWEIYFIYWDIITETWSDEIRISNASGNSYWSSVCASGNYVYIFWQDDRSSTFEVYYKYSSDFGATWSEEFLLTDNKGTLSQRPNVAISGETVHAVWMDNRNGLNTEIYYKRNPKGVILSNEEAEKGYNDLSILPNPAPDFIEIFYSGSQLSFLRMQESDLRSSSVRIYNVFGEEQLLSPAGGGEGGGSFSQYYKLDVSTLVPGLYFVRLGERIGKFLKI